MEYRATMENGGEYTRSSNGHGVPSWSLWDLGNWCSASHLATAPSSSSSSPPCSIATASTTAACSPFSDRRPLVPDGDHQRALLQQQYHHHMTCLKLGKRQYFGDVLDGGAAAAFAVAPPSSSTKRERPMGTLAAASSPAPPLPAASAAAVPRCQVDGCKKALVDEKEYHKRHKVCEMHSKAPKVVVLGAEQRFCQQCSRFHVISEFDDSKRSCRRRLAGHNERRRKSSSHESFIRNSSLAESTMTGGRAPYFTASSGRALSLLSSEDSPWVSASDISSRSSAALRELIAENRAAAIAGQLFTDRGGLHNVGGAINSSNFWLHQPQAASQSSSCQHNNNGWGSYQEAGNHVTLDLMQMPNSLEILSGSGKSKEDEECCDIWKSLAGTHVV